MDKALIERMVTLVRRVAEAREPLGMDIGTWFAVPDAVGCEAHAITALLPEPVDPDLIEARRLADELYPSNKPFTSGKYDANTVVEVALAGIKRGRELAAAPSDGWIEWHGGEMPVPRGVPIFVRHRSGCVFACQAGYGRADYWHHGAGPCDIVAYRLVAGQQ